MIPDLPEPWRQRLGGYDADEQTIGMSRAGVYRLAAPDRPTLFLKTEPAEPLAELPGEASRLIWLRSRDFPCPDVLGTTEHGGQHWLLMSALPGRDMASSPDLPVDDAIRISAAVLGRLHHLDWRDCPFDHRAPLRLAEARVRLDADLVDVEDFDTPMDPHEGLARLAAGLPVIEDLVVAHGDACYPNFMADGGAFTGFIDCGRLGVSDRWQDLALAVRSLEVNFGPGHAESFLRAYGAPLDPEKRAWYQLLDEFF